MGTNYYLYRNTCKHCGRCDEHDKLHVGKSSGGWCFGLHVFDDIKTLDDWKPLLEDPENEIRDEYGVKVEPAELLKIIAREGWDDRYLNRKVPFGYDSWESFNRSSHCEPGPRGLVRAQVDGRHCVGHGPGAWDYITGEFS